MRSVTLLLAIIFVTGIPGYSQSTPRQIIPILARRLESPSVTAYELRQYVMRHGPPLPHPKNARQWTAEADRVRQHLLDDIVFHGWPKEWVNSPPKFVDMGPVPVPAGAGYRMRKLRYEIVPGFWSTAILYEPENLHGRVPAVLNVNGHDYIAGKAADYKQKRCINFALRGMIALDPEWIDCGELNLQGNKHDFGAHLDLVGVNEIGLFYLAMRRGLDYLYDDPSVDQSRLAITGVSGGGWQTIVLSSLDKRVKAAVPVAGFASLVSGAEHPEWIGDDLEQNAPDFRKGVDYTFLTAMRAPRPTLLIYNTEDNCCFRAPIVKPYVYQAVKPFFQLYGKEQALAWHENLNPGTHNYLIDNRQAAYRFIDKHFNVQGPPAEIPVDLQVKSFQQLKVGLPKGNLTLLGLARQLSQNIKHMSPPSGTKDAVSKWVAPNKRTLTNLVRYQPVTVKRAWMITNTKDKGVATKSYEFGLSNKLSATGVWVKAIRNPSNSPVTIVLDDNGKKETATAVSRHVNRGDQVLALDLLFFGDAAPEKPGTPDYTQLLGAIGVRPLGIEAAQLIGITKWSQKLSNGSSVRLETFGMRSQMVALVACALEPGLFSQLVTHAGIKTLGYLLAKPVTYDEAPELFCLDLYKDFDVNMLAILASPTELTQKDSIQTGPQ